MSVYIAYEPNISGGSTVPSRISLVDPSSTCTPALISSIRTAILDPDQAPDILQSHKAMKTDHSSPKSAFANTNVDDSAGAQGTARTKASFRNSMLGKSSGKRDVSSPKSDKKLKIKEEGWIGTGVYGFELSGYSVFAGKGTSDFKYDT
jgi:hypothetical protein